MCARVCVALLDSLQLEYPSVCRIGFGFRTALACVGPLGSELGGDWLATAVVLWFEFGCGFGLVAPVFGLTPVSVWLRVTRFFS